MENKCATNLNKTKFLFRKWAKKNNKSAAPFVSNKVSHANLPELTAATTDSVWNALKHGQQNHQTPVQIVKRSSTK